MTVGKYSMSATADPSLEAWRSLVDLDRLAAWMDERGLGSGLIEGAQRPPGGTQNILIRFRRSGRDYMLRRPPLKEVRGDFKAGVEDRLVARLDTTFLDGLEGRWEIKVRSGAGAAIRAAATDPVRAERSSTVLATYKGGKFRVSDFMPWFYSMSLQQQNQLSSVTDDARLDEYLKTLVRNEVLLREANDQNVPP